MSDRNEYILGGRVNKSNLETAIRIVVALLFATAVVMLTSCGLQNQINELREKSNQGENIDGSMDARVAALEARVAATELTLVDVKSEMFVLNVQLESNDELTQQQIYDVTEQLHELQLQSQSLLVQLAVLQGYTSIVEIYNPCGIQSVSDEVFLKLSTGKFLASYSQTASGLNTRFVLLTDGTYSTTDQTSCHFTISNDGTTISNEHN